MAYHRISTGFVATSLLALQFQGAPAETAPKVIEDVDFAISCGPTSQQAFKHAAWTLHSFWYPEALKEFTAIAAVRTRLRDGLLGHRDESLVSAVVSTVSPAALKAGAEAVAKAVAAAPTEDRTRGGLHRCDRGLLSRQ